MPTQINKPLPDILGHERVLSAQRVVRCQRRDVPSPILGGKVPAALRVSDRRLGWRVKDLLEHLAKRAGVAA